MTICQFLDQQHRKEQLVDLVRNFSFEQLFHQLSTSERSIYLEKVYERAEGGSTLIANSLVSRDPSQSKTIRGFSPSMYSAILFDVSETDNLGFIKKTRSIPSFLACSSTIGLGSAICYRIIIHLSIRNFTNILPAKHTLVAPKDFADRAVHRPSDIPPNTNT